MSRQRTKPVTKGAQYGALVAYMVFLGDTQAREQIVFWQLGSFNGTRWEAVRVVAPLVLVGLVGLMLIARRLDLLSLGERAARHLGLNVERLRLVSIVIVALLVSAGVAFAGIIAFVGLVVPHLLRLAWGPDHRLLLPASMLYGAALLAAADVGARLAGGIPVGVVMAFLGAPFLLWLLRRAALDRSP